MCDGMYRVDRWVYIHGKAIDNRGTNGVWRGYLLATVTISYIPELCCVRGDKIVEQKAPPHVAAFSSAY